jgi:hypothetical protein
MRDGAKFVVPDGFTTDFASSRLFRWNFLSVDAATSHSSVLHDYLYATGKVTRLQADKYFHEGLRDTYGTTKMDRLKGYLGVRLGGWKAWYAYRDLNF